MLSKVPVIDELQKKYANKFKEMEKWTETLLLHPIVKEFMKDHPSVTKDMIYRSSNKVYDATREYDGCGSCRGLDQCSNLIKGHYGVLSQTGSTVDIKYSACDKYLAKKEQDRLGKLIQAHHISKDVLEARFQDVREVINKYSYPSAPTGTSLASAALAVWNFCQTVEPGKKGTKGIYLYGSFGVGKSYMMGAATRELAKRGISVLMVYTPDFFREIKDSIRSNKVQEKTQALKEVPVLILDDIGAENISEWVRDEVLGAILQYRISENLPTCYTSNLSNDLLEKHLAFTNKSIDEMNAKRIMERIRYYTKEYLIEGYNLREIND